MTDDELDRWLRQADPLARDARRRAAASAPAPELREAIMSTSRPPTPVRRLSRPSLVAGGAVGAVALAVALLVVLLPGRDADRGAVVVPAVEGTSPAPSSVSPPADLTRYVLTAPGWDVGWITVGEEYEGVKYNELAWVNATGDQLQLNWGATGSGAVESPQPSDSATVRPTITVTIDGVTTPVYQQDEEYRVVWIARGSDWQVRGGGFANAEEFAAVMATATAVTETDWFASLPDEVVLPDERGETVAGMLADIPTPEGFEAAEIIEKPVVTTRYHVGADVTGAVTCDWVAAWLDAREAGDQAAVDAAVAAMATAREWDVLTEMDAEGDYPEALLQIADAMSGDGTLDQGMPDIPLEDTVEGSLGCTLPD